MSLNQPKLRYYLLPARNPPSVYIDLHNKVFDFWMQSWKQTLAQIHMDHSHLHEEFIRQDVIGCLVSDKQDVVGVFLYSFFRIDTTAAKTFRYFVKNYPSEFFRRLDELNVRKVMATQYLTVHPDWRGKNKPTVPVSLILAGLSNRVRDLFDMDVGIGPTRRDHKVTELFYAYGGTCVLENILNHNVPCDLIANIRGRTHDHPCPDIHGIEKSIWDHRIDLVRQSWGSLERVA